MAKAINYNVPPPPRADAAREELDQLLLSLHDEGVLRFLNDFLRASPQVLEIVLRGLNHEASRNAVQNLSSLLIALGRIEPERFATVTRAFSAALASMERAADQPPRETRAPGLSGAYKALHDDDVWRRLTPLLQGVMSFANTLGEAPEKAAAKRNDGVGTGRE